MNTEPGPSLSPASSTPSNPLDVELRFFGNHQSEWKAKYPGKFILVKGEELINTFNRSEDAVAAGIQAFGTEPFLVRSVDQTEEGLFIPALAFGILQADVVAA